MGSLTDRDAAIVLLERLEQVYPEAECALNHRNPWQLLVATMLSAQCTDVRVNLVTPSLFERFPSPGAMADADLVEVEALIRSTGFFRNKAKNLIGCAAVLSVEYGGEVPTDLEQLVALPGVGRKTANVVLGNAFGIPGMVVDTHVKRLAGRFGWTRAEDPVKIEKDLQQLLPEERWTRAGHTLIAHGRTLCKAPTPVCSACPIADGCPRRGVTRSK
ncbi:endonuclease III [Geothermobacter hydrogeniphilus]|uniref:Endonuclease III n=1 Tax=Geothermobacter hydrogeniphilus TaxID=1969733 RepID=A0A2K2HAU1_9BACT|nr:endonuclease III [Geothermobacter hydrogeniphilus]PNU20381.1 endonuclease III [Geothermobacter hydrogeniphilus]